MKRRGERRGTLALLLVAALLLTVCPLPDILQPLRPYWMGLVVIYWVLEDRGSISLGMAFLLGLLMDLVTASLMGMHALSLVVLVYLVQRFRARLRFFPPWQQTIAILALLLNDRIVLLWVTTLLGEPLPTWHYWLPPMAGAVLWPWLFLFLDRARMGLRQSRR